MEQAGGPQGGTLFFSAYVRSDPASTVHPPKNVRNFKHPKKYLKLKQSQKISQFCTLTLKKTLNCIEMTLKLAQFCDDRPPKNIHKILIPQKIFIFLKTPKNMEIQNFEPPQKNGPSLRMCENFRVPPPPGRWP